MPVVRFVTGTSDLIIASKTIILKAFDEMVVNEESGYFIRKPIANNACNIIRGKCFVINCTMKNIKRAFIQHNRTPFCFRL